MIILFFDTETTGYPTPKNPPEIVQIGAILQDDQTMRILAEISLIVKATVPIPPKTTEVHHITDELSAGMGVDGEIADTLFGVLAGKADRLVSHNIVFDTGVINGTWPISKSAIENKETYCTMVEGANFDIPKHHAGSSKYPKLSDAYFYFYGVQFDGAHDALNDTRACRDVYFKLIEKSREN